MSIAYMIFESQYPSRPLDDISSTGRVRPWRLHKMANEILAMAYDKISEEKAARLRACATRLSFAVTSTGEKKLVGANFCRVRLCPVCQWRRALKVSGQTAAIIEAQQRLAARRYVLLTLTIKNVSPSGLEAAIDEIFRGWNLLTKRPEFKRAVKGWYRGLEVTHNTWDNAFHPHLHCLLQVLPSYPTSRYYLSHERWTELWQGAMHLSYTPIVDVRMCRGVTAAAIAEVAKYTCKVSDYLIPDDWDLSVETVALLDRVLCRRRLAMYGGEMRQRHRELRLDDVEDGSLTDMTQDELSELEREHIVSYVWYSGYRQYCLEE